MSDSKKPRSEFTVDEEGQRGLSGAYERILRRHKELVHALTLIPIYVFAAMLMGVALTPAIALFQRLSFLTEGQGTVLHALGLGVGCSLGFFVFGFGLIVVVPFANLFVRPFVRPERGQDHSSRFVGWYLHNALTYLVRYTFMEFITPTPFNLFFYRAMGMRVGKNVVINSSNISDPLLITLHEGVTIGGSAVILAHYGMGGYLIVAPVVIHKGATIGLHAKVLGGVEIGEGAKVLPNSVVMPKTLIPAGEIWGGVPAVKVGER